MIAIDLDQQQHVIDLYERVPLGAKVVMLPARS